MAPPWQVMECIIRMGRRIRKVLSVREFCKFILPSHSIRYSSTQRESQSQSPCQSSHAIVAAVAITINYLVIMNYVCKWIFIAKLLDTHYMCVCCVCAVHMGAKLERSLSGHRATSKQTHFHSSHFFIFDHLLLCRSSSSLLFF